MRSLMHNIDTDSAKTFEFIAYSAHIGHHSHRAFALNLLPREQAFTIQTPHYSGNPSLIITDHSIYSTSPSPRLRCRLRSENAIGTYNRIVPPHLYHISQSSIPSTTEATPQLSPTQRTGSPPIFTMPTAIGTRSILKPTSPPARAKTTPSTTIAITAPTRSATTGTTLKTPSSTTTTTTTETPPTSTLTFTKTPSSSLPSISISSTSTSSQRLTFQHTLHLSTTQIQTQTRYAILHYIPASTCSCHLTPQLIKKESRKLVREILRAFNAPLAPTWMGSAEGDLKRVRLVRYMPSKSESEKGGEEGQGGEGSGITYGNRTVEELVRMFEGRRGNMICGGRRGEDVNRPLETVTAAPVNANTEGTSTTTLRRTFTALQPQEIQDTAAFANTVPLRSVRCHPPAPAARIATQSAPALKNTPKRAPRDGPPDLVAPTYAKAPMLKVDVAPVAAIVESTSFIALQNRPWQFHKSHCVPQSPYIQYRGTQFQFFQTSSRPRTSGSPSPLTVSSTPICQTTEATFLFGSRYRHSDNNTEDSTSQAHSFKGSSSVSACEVQTSTVKDSTSRIYGGRLSYEGHQLLSHLNSKELHKGHTKLEGYSPPIPPTSIECFDPYSGVKYVNSAPRDHHNPPNNVLPSQQRRPAHPPRQDPHDDQHRAPPSHSLRHIHHHQRERPPPPAIPPCRGETTNTKTTPTATPTPSRPNSTSRFISFSLMDPLTKQPYPAHPPPPGPNTTTVTTDRNSDPTAALISSLMLYKTSPTPLTLVEFTTRCTLVDARIRLAFPHKADRVYSLSIEIPSGAREGGSVHLPLDLEMLVREMEGGGGVFGKAVVKVGVLWHGKDGEDEVTATAMDAAGKLGVEYEKMDRSFGGVSGKSGKSSKSGKSKKSGKSAKSEGGGRFALDDEFEDEDGDERWDGDAGGRDKGVNVGKAVMKGFGKIIKVLKKGEEILPQHMRA
ncbi:hypothetical protein DFH27DRAFT_652091 [Peziza echinospora]|nr:hypothetical protein DFH27DRAFT_652091 [Peziza echinospora]